MALSKISVPLNPKAPEFYPKTGVQEKPKFFHHVHRPMFSSNNHFPCQISEPAKTFHGKPRQPHCFWFFNRKHLPPRLLKQKVLVHKNRILSSRKPVPPPQEAKLESRPTPKEAKLQPLPTPKEAKLESLLPPKEAKIEYFPPPEEAKLESLSLPEEAKFKSLPPPTEAKIESLPPPEEAKLKSLFGDKTSVMIRNIPNNFRRRDLLRILDTHCWRENKEVDEQQQIRSSYDFLYLPMDFVRHGNLGYAFVNFTSSVAAERFRREFDNFCWTNFVCKKICQISLAKYQGKEEFSKHFKDSRFTCHTDDYLPVVLSPPSDGFTGYSLTTLGHRIRSRGGCRRSQPGRLIF